MEDSKEMIELCPISTSSNNHLHLHSTGAGGGHAPPSVPPTSMSAPTSLVASYLHHSQHLQSHQQQQTHHPPSCSPPLHPQNPHQLPHAHQHFDHSLVRVRDPDIDDILMRRTGTEHHRCADDTSEPTSVLSHPIGIVGAGVDAGLLNPHPLYSSLHIPNARRSSSEPTHSMNAAVHFQEDLGINTKPSISEASTTTPPQPSGTQHITHMTMGLPSPDLFKRKRGRARKCSADSTSSIVLSMATKIGHHFGERGQIGALVQGLMPYVIAIARGEGLGILLYAGTSSTMEIQALDVSIRIASFQQENSWGICVLSALGSISNVTLRHSETSDSIITYEGCYDILSLSGSLSPEGSQNRGGLIVSLAGLDGQVIGGEVTGIFVAASPIKVVVGTFLSEAYRSQMQGGSALNISQAETATGSPSCVTIPRQSSTYC